jgi:hypothetical protein
MTWKILNIVRNMTDNTILVNKVSGAIVFGKSTFNVIGDNSFCRVLSNEDTKELAFIFFNEYDKNFINCVKVHKQNNKKYRKAICSIKLIRDFNLKGTYNFKISNIDGCDCLVINYDKRKEVEK